MDRAEFGDYAERYKDTVYRVALNFMGNAQDAEDAVQETLLKLFLSREKFESEEHVKRWMIRVALNFCKNAARAQKRRVPTPPEELALSVPFEAEEQTALFTAVMSLPDKYRVPLYLFYYEEYSVKEIAHILEISDSAVTTRLQRARARLRSELVEERV